MVHTVPATEDNTNQDKPFLCDCGATFKTSTELNDHNQKEHSKGVAEFTPPEA